MYITMDIVKKNMYSYYMYWVYKFKYIMYVRPFYK